MESNHASRAASDADTSKRKMEDTPLPSGKVAKKRAPSLRVALKGTRFALQQKAVAWDRTMPVLRAVLHFQSFLATRDLEPLTEVPAEHRTVIASLSQESEKSALDIAKSIHATLLPEGHLDHGDASSEPRNILTVPVLEAAVHQVASRVNYGLDDTAHGKPVPPTLQLWRWEVADLSLLPKENLEKLLARREERERARSDAATLFHSLAADAQHALLDNKKRVARRAPNGAKETSAAQAAESAASSGAPPPARTLVAGAEDDADAVLEGPPAVSEGPSPPLERPPAVPEGPSEAASPSDKTGGTPAKEKSVRTKERASRRAERQAKEERHEKDKQAQARLFNSFFQQPAARDAASKTTDDDGRTDYERTFLPCEYKSLAEPNRFFRNVGDELWSAIDAREKPQQEMLAEFQSMARQRLGQPRNRRGIHPAVCVRDIMQAVRESDVLGGDMEERAKRGLEKLNNRRLLPVKLLQFQSDRRPGWIGTFTRATAFVTPRKPFGQDPIALDYTYDSDAEWDEMDEGENVDDAADEREDDESMIGSGDESEMDDWLEDDLEEEEEAAAPVSVPAPMDVDAHRSSPAPRNTVTNVLEPKKKVKFIGRRFDAKLVPYISGPHWEDVLGEPGHESFDPYVIQFLHDAHVGLDPFTFMSRAAVDDAADDQPSAKCSAPVAAGETASPAPECAPRPTKFNFPDTHLPELLRLIQGSTRSKPALVEDLREHFGPLVKGVSKASIESRLQECAVKESKRPGAQWVIRAEWKERLS
ncbi:hypothetical protein MSPP1_002379 [Malassezia sp. CBS 17886]|nr:hypothetical protein MSPP1_002379 [Malassezia sp. CBS 17886]